MKNVVEKQSFTRLGNPNACNSNIVYCRDLQDQVAMAQGLRWGQGDLE